MLKKLIKESERLAMILDKMFSYTLQNGTNIERVGKLNRLMETVPTQAFIIQCDYVRAQIFLIRQQSQFHPLPHPNEKLAEYAAYVEDKRQQHILYLNYLDEQLTILEDANCVVR